ncbi:hypothetical protein SprV_0602204700 [Sparganum proliferum]
MTRVLIDDCHRRLQKYKAEIEENRRQGVHTLGDSIAADLGKTISALAHHRQAKKREVLERKLTRLKPPDTESSNLVHNLSSKQLTEQQLRVLQHETCFNTADADPVDFIAALEAMLVRSETSDDMKHSVRQRVTSLLMTHRPTKCISQNLRGWRIQSDEIMVSFDVTSLFTSIPPNLARGVLRKRLEEAYDETQNALKIEHLMRLFEFCQQTFFTFAGKTYEQIEGTPMGPPVSGLGAELVVKELEKIAFIQHEPVFWRRYVDDTFVIVKKDMLQHFHSLLNAVFPDIKFTREEEQEQQLPFLDVLVRRNLNGQTGRMLGSRIHEHKLAVRRGDASSQVAAHTYEMGHELNFSATKIVAHAGNKTGRELIEAWASDENSVNQFIDLAPAYRALRSRLQSWAYMPYNCRLFCVCHYL